MKLFKLKKLKRIWKKSAKRLDFGVLKRIAVVLLLIGLNWSGITAVGQTFAYFNDAETAGQNIYTAGFLDMALTSTGDFSSQVTPTQNSLRDITVAKQGGLDFQYKVKIDNLSGDFCQNLNLKATLNSITLYDGSLAGFNIAATTDLGTINFVASSNAHGFSQACNFNLVFTGWQVNLGNENLGFSDEESISNSIVGGRDQNDVVLNEFLPNPIGVDTQDGILGEWVEFYNNSNHAIDMTGWYTEDAVGASHRRTISTATTYNEQTTIGAKGSGSEWLVLFMNDDILNNTGDTINLYDNYGGLVDTHSYSGSDYNINDTPGGTNNLVAYLPFNNNLLDKSGNGNNGTNHGTTFVAGGKVEQALNLSGTQYVEAPDSSSLDITDQITLEAWVYPTAWSSNENNILTKGSDNNYGVWNLHHTNGGFRLELNNGSTLQVFENTPSTALGVWYHVVGVYDGSEMKLYVNGVLKGSLTTSGSIVTNDLPLRIGKQWYWGSNYSYWTGRIDEVKIYNRALGATEVLEHFSTVNNGATSIPENKSFARIPDGTGAWVDPIPTPGKPNVLENQEPIINFQSENLSASPSFSETLELTASTISEFVLGGGEEVIASASAETIVDIPDLALVSSISIEPLSLPDPSIEPSPETSPELLVDSVGSPQVTPEPLETQEPEPSADSGQTTTLNQEQAIASDPATIQAPAQIESGDGGSGDVPAFEVTPLE